MTDTSVEIPERVALRAARRFRMGTNGCHISTYSVGSHRYAQIGWRVPGGVRVTTAHRASWVAKHGQISDDLTVDHVCRQRRCVNVAHLRLLTRSENGRDGGLRGRK